MWREVIDEGSYDNSCTFYNSIMRVFCLLFSVLTETFERGTDHSEILSLYMGRHIFGDNDSSEAETYHPLIVFRVALFRVYGPRSRLLNAASNVCTFKILLTMTYNYIALPAW